MTPLEISREAQEKLAQALGGTTGTAATGEKEPATDATPLARIAGIIEKVTGVDAETVTAESRLAEDLDINSLSLIEIVVNIEDAFRVEIPEDTIWSAETVADLVTAARPDLAGRHEAAESRGSGEAAGA